MPRQRAIIIGGSLGGLLAAHLMRQIGWDAVVFERNNADLVSRGAGLGTHPALMDVLRRIGIPFDDSMGLQVPKAIFLDRDGRIVDERRTVRTMSAWGRLYRAVRDPLPADAYRLGMSLKRIEQDADGVTAVFDDGSRERGALLIGADGLRSTVREQMLPDVQPRYAGYVAWRVLLDEKDVPERSASRFSSTIRSAFRKASCCSPIRCRAATTRPARASVPTTSFGTGRSNPIAPWSTFAPMRPAVTTPWPFHRR